MESLTRPTLGRLVLWLVLACLWFLFLLQALFPPTTHPRYSAVGAVFWAVVQFGLVWAAVVTWRRRRAANRNRRDESQ